MQDEEKRIRALRTVKTCHTIVWAFLAGCVVAIPLLAWQQRFGVALVLIAIVLAETLVLASNRWRCPLTDVAERYTGERSANFDIYLPDWLARYNKQIFGTWFVAGSLYTLLAWLGSQANG